MLNLKISAFNLEQIIKIIPNIILKGIKNDPILKNKVFVINITEETKLMVAAASNAAYLAGSRIYYVMK